jgi:hypothetical protein
VKAAQPNLATYYLRSSVLGGQVIEELNSTGAKQQSLIYIGRKIVGHDWANGNVLLLHEDPSGTTVHSSLPDSAFVWDFTDLDPWGAEIFSSDPYLEDPEFSGGRGESGPTYSGYGDISMPSNGCMLDGGYTLCEFLRNSESLAFQVTAGGKSKQFPLAPGLLGIFAAWVEDDGKKLTKPQTPNGSEFDEGDTIVTNMDSDGLGHWELINLAFPQEPVTNSPITIDNSGSQNQACAIQVSFSGKYDGLPNGPSVPRANGVPSYGIGFSVSVSGLSGKVALRSSEQDPKPKRTWLVEQWVADYNFRDGQVVRHDTKAQMDNLARAVPGPRRDGDTVSWWDHPGDQTPGMRGYFTKRNFYIKAYNGTRHCEVAFHLTFRVFNGVITNVGWGPGNYNR